MKPSFLNHSKPLVVSMIQAETPQACISMIKNSIYDGADAFGIQLCRITKELRAVEELKKIFASTAQRPIYITNYRVSHNKNMTDEECMDGLVDGLKYGATIADIMGDTFAPSDMELTTNHIAIDKQKRLIDKIHNMGKEVLMSSHVLRFISCEQVLEIAYAHQSRGADIVKIVTAASSVEEELENLRITSILKKELNVPFLFLSGGTHYKLHRMIGPMLGCVAYLCVQQHDELSTKAQPILKSVRAVLDITDYLPDYLT
ncbi:MAG: type I 3-dehydroquinate dehydratase [Clostridiales bacterium]|nr:type I 3-dehydroquinate dehydratase [Clostridiales bacterium]